ncbi:FtsX-like permease family protein [Enterococcus sp.]|uniref:FtsX-like permease family protein n=1 Tax=Enterococcus sp. TaxID=35783 RepID=UPI00289FC0D8|nr:FtsX-like permease family protein [Enterococcus sp.]
MKNKTYLKASFREISESKGRFIAITLIIFLGTFLFVGVKATGPILNHSASAYVDGQQLADLQVTSTMGLTDEDIALAEKSDAQVESAYQFYAAVNSDEVVQVNSYNKDHTLNQLLIKEGHLPKNKDEILLDTEAKNYGYQLGDTYTFDQTENLSQESYTIVGFADSPMYISVAERGYANVGSGVVSYFAYIPEDTFTMEVKSILYFSFDDVQSLETYSDAYEEKMDNHQETIEALFADRPQTRLAEIKAEAMEDITPAQDELTDNQTKLDDAQEQLDAAKEQLATQKEALSQLPQAQQAALTTEVTAGEAELTQQQETLDAQQEQLDDAQQTINDNLADLDALEEPTYLYNQRKDNPGFQEYGGLSDRIAAIANVFPVFFFFIAALITFTTLSRMVEENRKEIGTLKALGYGKAEISIKYLIYALLSSAIGILSGAVLGTELLPRLIYFLSSDRYLLDGIRVYYVWSPIILAASAFLIAALGACLFVLIKELREKPAQLLQVRAPKPGKRIFLERITPLWSRLSFNQKVSFRNIFRYKSRMVMAIIGIAGCTGLMVAGVGLKDSLGSVTSKQFGPITDYQAVVTLTDSKEATLKKAEATLDKDTGVTDTLAVNSENIEIRPENQGKQSLTLMVPADNDTFTDYVHLTSLEGNALSLNDNGAVLTMKYAELYDINVGDSLTFYTSDQESFTVKISGIAENYLGNSLYLSQETYEAITDSDFTPNTLLLKSDTMNQKQEENLSTALLETDSVKNTTFLSTQINTQNESMGNLDSIVLILVVLSGALAFVVLYNLTNINVSERIRELSTIKVLGFYNKEVTMYIVRENIVFTLFGILAGYAVGYFLTDFILMQASMENMVFPLVINWPAYALAGGMTILFTVIVMFVTHIKLTHVNMIDALKSNE